MVPKKCVSIEGVPPGSLHQLMRNVAGKDDVRVSNGFPRSSQTHPLFSLAPGLNEELVQLLLIRDELHTEQDAMLVDIEDLTR